MNFQHAEYLHDAVISALNITMDAQGRRTAVLCAECDEDCGSDDWSGQPIRITFEDMILLQGEVLGYTANFESFNLLSECLSEQFKNKVRQLEAFGISPAVHLVRVVLHSGSSFEIACNEIKITLVNDGSSEVQKEESS